MKNGLSSWCSKCHRAAVQDWRERNRDEINAARRAAYGSSKPHRYPKTRAQRGTRLASSDWTSSSRPFDFYAGLIVPRCANSAPPNSYPP
jgi:hypothetical protein